MKVICKCCHKAFDYDMYMGLCPKCGRVYRRGRSHYSEIEKNMIGDFHLHADEGGLNRGIEGVVYNQGTPQSMQAMDTIGEVITKKAPNSYYSPEHQTKINRVVVNQKNMNTATRLNNPRNNKKSSSGLGSILFVIIFVIAILYGMFS
ncbi:MAG: hypothetical protein K6F55_05935 [Eubacterium sp.]|nr:hypothetical protein [Eubacterium sp.]